MNLTAEQQADSDSRIKQFKEGYESLVEKLQVDLIFYPQLVPDDSGKFSIVLGSTIVDKKNLPVRSPFIQQS